MSGGDHPERKEDNRVDITNLDKYIIMAAALAVAAGPVAAAITQIIKVAYGMFAKGASLPENAQAILAAVIGAGLVAWQMIAQGVPWQVAVAAIVVALFTPKASYDAAKSLHNTAANTVTEEDPPG